MCVCVTHTAFLSCEGALLQGGAIGIVYAFNCPLLELVRLMVRWHCVLQGLSCSRENVLGDDNHQWEPRDGVRPM